MHFLLNFRHSIIVCRWKTGKLSKFEKFINFSFKRIIQVSLDSTAVSLPIWRRQYLASSRRRFLLLEKTWAKRQHSRSDLGRFSRRDILRIFRSKNHSFRYRNALYMHIEIMDVLFNFLRILLFLVSRTNRRNEERL